jgi:hypothetical protein
MFMYKRVLNSNVLVFDNFTDFSSVFFVLYNRGWKIVKNYNRNTIFIPLFNIDGRRAKLYEIENSKCCYVVEIINHN